MQVYCAEVFNLPVTGTATVYTSPEHYGVLASAEKMFASARVSQVGGTTVGLTVSIERSNDGLSFDPLTPALLSGSNLSPTAATPVYNEFNATKVLGCYVRLAIAITAVSGTPTMSLQITVSGHDA